MTLFNPSDFISDLEEIGLEVVRDDVTKKIFFGKKIGKGVIRFEYFSYFFSLIQNNLHTPDAVISLIKEFILLAESHAGSGKAVKISAEIFHLFTHYNKDNLD